jgi:hypothetical protein
VLVDAVYRTDGPKANFQRLFDRTGGPPMHRRLLAATALLLVACSDSTAPTGDPQTDADLAVSAGDAAASDVALMIAGDVGAGLATSSAAPTAAFGGCTYNPGRGNWACGSSTDGTLTVTRSFTFYDAAGAAQPSFDAATTARIEHKVDVTGSVQRGEGYTASLERHRVLTVTPKAIGDWSERHWNGTGTEAVDAEHEGDRLTRHYTLTSSTQVTDVVFRTPRVANPWPLSGTVEHDVHAVLTREGVTNVTRTMDREIVVTFNGTKLVPVTVNGHSFTLNLETRRIVK